MSNKNRKKNINSYDSDLESTMMRTDANYSDMTDAIKQRFTDGWAYIFMWVLAILMCVGVGTVAIGVYIQLGYSVEIEDDLDKVVKLLKAVNASLSIV